MSKATTTTTTKNVTLLTGDPNGPPLIQKRQVTNAGPQLSSYDPKTLHFSLRTPTDLLDV